MVLTNVIGDLQSDEPVIDGMTAKQVIRFRGLQKIQLHILPFLPKTHEIRINLVLIGGWIHCWFSPSRHKEYRPKSVWESGDMLHKSLQKFLQIKCLNLF